MVFSPDNQLDDQMEVETTSSSSPATSAQSKFDWTAELGSDQFFRLVDSILPFEACLYHQILPLALEGSHLKLGIVNLYDSTALDYVRRILAYMNCSLIPQKISSEIHHAALSAYLNHVGTQKSATSSNVRSQSIVKRIERKLAQESARNKSSSDENHLDIDAKPTLLVDSPEELAEARSSKHHPSTGDRLQPTPPVPAPQAPEETPPQELKSPAIQAPSPKAASSVSSLPVLQVEAKHLMDPIDVLATLPPKSMLQELLARVLVGGIGRLYFERQSNQGRILWSQNGVLQSVLEDLSLETLQGVIDELKRMTQMSLFPVQKPKQVEIERLYQKTHLLLRLRVMPGSDGEEATLQVLRGAALKFYQQQQLATLSRDTLKVAQELEQKVSELCRQTHSFSTLTSEQLSILPTLEGVLRSVEQQLALLKQLQFSKTPTHE